MASSSRAAGSGSTRRIGWLAAGVAVAVLLYTGGWFYGAGQLSRFLQDRMTASEETAFSVSCSDLDVRGFPFRVGIFCDRVGIDDRSSGTSVSVGELRSAAQVYRPGHAVIEIDGPAQMRVSPDFALTADWSLLRASMVAWRDGLERGSLAYDDLTGRINMPAIGTSVGFAAGHGEVHVRQNGDALDAALSMDALLLDMPGSVLPKLDLAADLTFANAAGWISMEGPSADAPFGSSGDLRRLSLDIGDGRVAALSGPFSIGEEGALSGSFELDVRGIDAWRDAIVSAFPDVQDTVANVAETIKGLSGDGKNAVVRLTVTDDTVYLGLIPITFIDFF